MCDEILKKTITKLPGRRYAGWYSKPTLSKQILKISPRELYVFAPRIVIQLCDVNQQNALLEIMF